VPVLPLVHDLPFTSQEVTPEFAAGVVFLSSSFLQDVTVISAMALTKNSLVMFLMWFLVV
jgi:hypothetical protein